MLHAVTRELTLSIDFFSPQLAAQRSECSSFRQPAYFSTPFLFGLLGVAYVIPTVVVFAVLLQLLPLFRIPHHSCRLSRLLSSAASTIIGAWSPGGSFTALLSLLLRCAWSYLLARGYRTVRPFLWAAKPGRMQVATTLLKLLCLRPSPAIPSSPLLSNHWPEPLPIFAARLV